MNLPSDTLYTSRVIRFVFLSLTSSQSACAHWNHWSIFTWDRIAANHSREFQTRCDYLPITMIVNRYSKFISISMWCEGLNASWIGLYLLVKSDINSTCSLLHKLSSKHTFGHSWNYISTGISKFRVTPVFLNASLSIDTDCRSITNFRYSFLIEISLLIILSDQIPDEIKEAVSWQQWTQCTPGRDTRAYGTYNVGREQQSTVSLTKRNLDSNK